MKIFLTTILLLACSILIFGISYKLLFEKDKLIKKESTIISNTNSIDNNYDTISKKQEKNKNINKTLTNKLKEEEYIEKKYITSSDVSSKNKYKQKIEIDIVRTGPDGSLVIAGKGIPNSYIKLIENNMILSDTIIDKNGEWVIILNTPLNTGSHLLSLEMKSENGELFVSERAIVIDLKDEFDEPLIALVPLKDNVTPTVINIPEQKDLKINKEDIKVRENNSKIYIETISWEKNGNLRINGKFSGEGKIVGTVENNKFTEIQKLDKISWTAKVNVSDIKNKRKKVKMLVSILSENSNQLDAHEIYFQIIQLDKGKDGSKMVVVNKGDALWRIAYRVYGKGIKYLDIVSKNKIINPDLIFPSEVFVVPK